MLRVKAVATQACRGATNGPAFVRRVHEETGLKLQIISPREEAQLSVAGCMSLFDREQDAALVVDVGGGSTELSWVDLKGDGLDAKPRQFAAWKLPIKAWLSIPVGVVTLAERFPEGERANPDWFRAMVDDVKARIEAFPHAEPMREIFARGRAHLVGTSGAITSLAGLHLGLPRYDRNIVDGLWMDRTDCDAAVGEYTIGVITGSTAVTFLETIGTPGDVAHCVLIGSRGRCTDKGTQTTAQEAAQTKSACTTAGGQWTPAFVQRNKQLESQLEGVATSWR